jgi:hypothetical protein
MVPNSTVTLVLPKAKTCRNYEQYEDFHSDGLTITRSMRLSVTNLPDRQASGTAVPLVDLVELLDWAYGGKPAARPTDEEPA